MMISFFPALISEEDKEPRGEIIYTRGSLHLPSEVVVLRSEIIFCIRERRVDSLVGDLNSAKEALFLI